MAKVKALTTGFYGNKKRKEGEIFYMDEVNAEGVYIDKEGKPILEKNRRGEMEPKKCKWVTTNLKARPPKDRDPEAMARAISGKHAKTKGDPSPEEDDLAEEIEEQEEAEEETEVEAEAETEVEAEAESEDPAPKKSALPLPKKKGGKKK